MIVDKNIHILHIVSGDLWAGAEVQLYTLLKAIHPLPGISVSVVILNHGRLEQELQNTGINITVLDEEKLNGLDIFFQLLSIIRKTSPDVIHTHRLKENILGSMAAYLCGNIPSLRTVHGAPEHPPSWRKLPKKLIHWLDWFCGRFLQKKIISVSGDLAELLKKDFPAEKIDIIENGVDIEATREYAVKIQSAPPNIDDTLKIGIAGRLVPVKRVDVFIETAQHIFEHYPEIHAEFHIYGDGPLQKELEEISHKLAPGVAVIFEGHCDDILSKLGELDALLMTSDHEGLPMILLEAMALEIPVIAHGVGGIPHLLDHGACGILVENNTAEHFASAIYQLVNNSEKTSEMKSNSLQRVKQKYSAENNAQAYISQYMSIKK